MIDLFRTWLPQIVGYPQAVQDGTLAKAWTEGDRSGTSAHYSGELFEQVFGDLDADNMMPQARQSLGEHPALVKALHAFLSSLKRLDQWIDAHVDTDTWGRGEIIPASVSAILHTQEWSDAQSAGATLTLIAGRAGISGNDFDPTQSVH